MKNFVKKTMLFSLLATMVVTCSNNGADKEAGQSFENESRYFMPDKNTKVLKVGKDKEFKTIGEASVAATNNCIVEVDAGIYTGDVAQWVQDSLVIRAIGGEVVLDAAGKSMKEMAIWVINGGTIYIEGFTFRNCTVRDKNGAGIRHSKGFVTVKSCRFLNNENGVLTSNDGVSTLMVLNSEFGYNGAGDGYSHNIYVGKIAGFEVSGSWFHHVDEGHLIKTRAKISKIKYNLIADGNDEQSLASYEIDFASGGVGVVVGNIIQQSRNTRNPTIISYSREADRPWTENELYVSYNTIINNRSNSELIINAPETPVMYQGAFNNLFSENTHFDMKFMDLETNNIWFKTGDLTTDYIPTKQAYDLWLNKTDRDIDRHLSPKLKEMGVTLVPAAEYQHPMKIKPLEQAPLIPGAIQNPAL